MTILRRKFIVIFAVAAMIALVSATAIVRCLEHVGLGRWGQEIRSELLTGTAIAVIGILLILLVPRIECPSWPQPIRSCPVCDHPLTRKGRFCPECGSLLNEWTF